MGTSLSKSGTFLWVRVNASHKNRAIKHILIKENFERARYVLKLGLKSTKKRIFYNFFRYIREF